MMFHPPSLSDEIAFVADVATIVSAIALLYGLLNHASRRTKELHLRSERCRQRIMNDPNHRRIISDTLRRSPVTTFYIDRLNGALALIERLYGPPNNPHALSLSIWLALVYCWILFMGICASGGRCEVLTGGMDLSRLWSDDGLESKVFVAVLLASPVAGWAFYICGKHLGHWIRRYNVLRRRRCEMNAGNRRGVAMLVGILVLFPLSIAAFNLEVLIWTAILAALPVPALVGGYAGWRVQLRINMPWLATTVAGVISIGVAGLVAFAAYTHVFDLYIDTEWQELQQQAKEDNSIRPQMEAHLLATVAFVVTATLGGVAAAYAGLATLGFLNGKTRRASRTTTRQGIFLTSSLGGCIGWATVALVSVAEGSVILVVTFLLLMPIVNGTFDWLSWWISRWCGSNLVRTLATQPGPFSVISTITKHGAIDLGAAVVLFLGLLFWLEFWILGSEWGRPFVLVGVLDWSNIVVSEASGDVIWRLAKQSLMPCPDRGMRAMDFGSP